LLPYTSLLSKLELKLTSRAPTLRTASQIRLISLKMGKGKTCDKLYSFSS